MLLRSQFDHLIGQVLDQFPDLSDIICTVGKPVQAEVHGELTDVRLAPDPGLLVPWQVESLAVCMLSGNMRLYRDLVQRGSCDLSYEVRGQGRFRVNVFQQQGSLALVMRKLSMQVPTLEGLKMPAVFRDMAREKFGLILVTGATGTGKSTSLAALVDGINASSSQHILTLEDPVEFVHTHKKGTVNQREFGIDFDSFASGLRAALRQAPKVILVGEIRDKETISIALEAAETGHLVLGTLHTSDTAQTINRIIGMFELGEERLIRGRLAESLKYIVSQRLMPRQQGGRVAAFEVLVNNIRIRELIQNGEQEEKTFARVLESGTNAGMIHFDQYLADLFERGTVSEEIAMLNGSDKSNLGQMIDRIKSRRGEKVTDIEGLELDTEYDLTK
ncbi:MAG: PilT/PilU family type 4a pilus ATPase [Desulfohalobiaceae bacterium]|nr:PilT/PilU family type 4a pilus ATPase [Desulfohalobiaceae bacterium]